MPTEGVFGGILAMESQGAFAADMAAEAEFGSGFGGAAGPIGLPAGRADEDEQDDSILPEQRNRAAMALAALGDETRLDIFRLLTMTGPAGLSPAAISTELDIALRVAAKHLSRLRRAQLVHETRSGRRVTFRADTGLARDCLTFVHELADVLRPES
jgi:ArsR family transcriptional regulator